jgi:peptide subunit release factor 1 (eRF1)
MQKSTTALDTPLRDELDGLAMFEPTDSPVVSVYLNLKPDEQGQRTSHAAFLRKVFPARIRTLTGEARKSVERDAERIQKYLAAEVKTSSSSVAIFACAAQHGFFQPVQLDVPMDDHWLFIGSVPHLYPLARLNDQYPRYAALLLDTNSARLFVFGLGSTEARRRISNVKTRKSSVGGWSQARYQRHAENYHLHHIKEVVWVLDDVVRKEHIGQIIVACDPTARPLLMEHLPKHLAEKIVDVVNLDMKAPEHEVLSATLDALRQSDADSDVAKVDAMLGAWRAGGLAVVGPEDTLDALVKGQVEELLISATPDRLRRARTLPPGTSPGPVEVDTSAATPALDADLLKLADELVTKAQQTAARIRFIEDAELLSEVGGVGALLRFTITKQP